MVAVLLAACSQGGGSVDPQLGVAASPRVASGRSMAKGGGIYKVGNPYRIGSRWYVPREDRAYDRIGIASWYGAEFHGRRTSNGEIYDMYALTAGHPTLPMPSYAYVTNLQNGRTILVRVNDRGPYVNDRLIDLSWQSSHALGFSGRGLARVRVRYAGRAPLNGDDRAERRHLSAQPESRSYASTAPAQGATITTGSISRGSAGRMSPAGLGGPPDTYVNVGPFDSPAEAERMRRALAPFGAAQVAARPESAEASFGVRIGPFSRSGAEATAKRIAAAGVVAHSGPDSSSAEAPAESGRPSLTPEVW